MTTLFYNGKIHSMDETLTTATAMVVCGGKIMELGADHALMQKYPDADLHDLAGSTVIPGLIDSHAHMFMAADSEGDGELFIPDSVEQLLADLARRVKTVPKGEWIGYKNTYPLRLRELRYPTREELDRIAPEHPVAVDGFYSAQLNSCALAALDLNALWRRSWRRITAWESRPRSRVCRTRRALMRWSSCSVRASRRCACATR